MDLRRLQNESKANEREKIRKRLSPDRRKWRIKKEVLTNQVIIGMPDKKSNTYHPFDNFGFFQLYCFNKFNPDPLYHLLDKDIVLWNSGSFSEIKSIMLPFNPASLQVRK